MWRRLRGLTLVLLVSGCAAGGELKSFVTDGCSSFPNGTATHKDLWWKCCETHDLAYWRGGTFAERKAADRALRGCVDGVGEPEIAELMYDGVRAGGTPYLPTSYRWGYGWPYPRGYKTLTEAEMALVAKRLAEQGINKK